MPDVELTATLLERLARRNNFEIPGEDLVFFGLRGLLPVDISGTPFAASHVLRSADIDNVRMRCTIGQLRTQDHGIAVFPGSTVPSMPNIQNARANRGVGANMLMLGRYKYERGVHKLGLRSGHRAFRQAIFFPVWRTTDDLDYDLNDVADLDGGFVYDNLHCAYHDNLDRAGFSSAGCQVVCGHPSSPARGNRPETGPWKRFVENTYDAPVRQPTYTYMLFSGAEAAMVAGAPDSKISQSLRFGSGGDLVRQAQKALIAKGMPLEEPEGDYGRATIEAVMAFQTKEFGRGSADGIIGPNTAHALGFELPKLDGGNADQSAPLIRASLSTVEASLQLATEPHRVAISRQGDDWLASADGKKPFYIGTSVKFGRFTGIYQPSSKLKDLPVGKYASDVWSQKLGNRGPWAYFLEPTIVGESQRYLCRVNTYDGAGLTFGPLQFASHTPRDNLILLFRELLGTAEGQRWFPDLVIAGGKVARRTASGPVSLENVAPNGRLADFMDYLNPDATTVSEAEAISAGRLMGWMAESEDSIRIQFDLAIRVFTERINRLGSRYGVDLANQSMANLIWVADIRHHGRGTYQQMKSALQSAKPGDALAAIGASDARWRDRIKAVKATIALVSPKLAGETWGQGAFAM